MQTLFVIFIFAAIIWGIVKKHMKEGSQRHGGYTSHRDTSRPRRTSRRPTRPTSLLDELRQQRERDDAELLDRTPKQPRKTGHIPIIGADETDRKPRPVPPARAAKKPTKDAEATQPPPPPARPKRRPIRVARIRDPWEPEEGPRDVSVAEVKSPGEVPKKPPAVPGTKRALAGYQKEIGGSMWDDRINGRISENLSEREELVATARGTGGTVLAVTDRKLMLIRPSDPMGTSSSEVGLRTWDYADVDRIELAKDWLNCTLTIIATDTPPEGDPARADCTFTYQRMYHEKMEALAEHISGQLRT